MALGARTVNSVSARFGTNWHVRFWFGYQEAQAGRALILFGTESAEIDADCARDDHLETDLAQSGSDYGNRAGHG